jgi:hypothetical protein
VFIIGGDGTARIEAQDKSELDIAEDELAFLVGEFVLKLEDGHFVLAQPILQRWLSDVMLLNGEVIEDSSAVDSVSSGTFEGSIVESSTSTSSSSTTATCTGTAKAYVRIPYYNDYTCANYEPNSFTGKVTYRTDIEVMTLIANEACSCPGWHARVSVAGAMIEDGLNMVAQTTFPIPCGRGSKTITVVFDPAVPSSTHTVTVELKSNHQAPPFPLPPGWTESACCFKIVRSLGFVTLPPKCGDTTLAPTP